MSDVEEKHASVEQESVVGISAFTSPSISFSDYYNGIPIFHALEILNDTNDELQSIELSVESNPPIFSPKKWRVDSINPHSRYPIHNLELDVDPRVLQGLTERDQAVLEFKLQSLDEPREIASIRKNIDLLPRNHWSGLSSHLPEVIAAYSQPNDPAVDRIIKSAAEILRSADRPASFNGYEDGPGHAWELANAIWNAVSALDFTYVFPPASFESHGQKVRTPGNMLDSRVGTCLDLTLLFTALLEQASLNPIIVFTQGHAFPGFWLNPRTLAAGSVDDPSQIRNHLNLKELILFESTLVTDKSRMVKFSEAIATGGKNIAFEKSDDFILAVDIKQARSNGIRPLASLQASHPGGSDTETEPKATLQLEAIPNGIVGEPVSIDESIPSTPAGKLDQWQRKLLDLSKRNKLLNFKTSKKTLRVELGSASAIEDMIASGRKISFEPTPDMAYRRDEIAQIQLEAIGREKLTEEVIQAAYEKRTLLVRKYKDEIVATLTALYRESRLALEEGGSNILYLTFGYLSWRESGNSERSYLAPLLLVPMEIERKSARTGFTLHIHDDGPKFNSTLLQLLKQDFRITLPVSDDDLPQDGSGVDIERLWQRVRKSVEGMRGWEVVERVDLATFSFSKYLMWKDMVDRTDALKENLVVRQLLNGKDDQFPEQGDFPEPRTLDSKYSPQNVFTPLPSDSSQLATVLAASKGKSFVVIGPPGTGKSQTIANIITQTLAEGKTVLFVSEKIAALEVVHRRLREIGLGDHCLELHSNKANKKGVLSQLENAWYSSGNSTVESGWKDNANQLEGLRRQLNEYVHELHKSHANGLTLYGQLGHIASGRDIPCIQLDPSPELNDSRDKYKLMESAAVTVRQRLDELSAGSIVDPSLKMVGVESWSLQFQSLAIDAAKSAERGISTAIRCLSAFAEEVWMPVSAWTAVEQASFGALAEVLTSAPDTKLTTATKEGASPLLGTVREAREVAGEVLAYDQLVASWWEPPSTDISDEPEVKHLQSLISSLSATYTDRFDTAALAQITTEWDQANKKFFLFRGKAQSQVQSNLATYTVESALPNVGADLPLLGQIMQARSLIETRRQALVDKMGSYGDLASKAPDVWRGARTNLEDLEWSLSLAEVLNQKFSSLPHDKRTTLHRRLEELLGQGGTEKTTLVALAQSVRNALDPLEGLSSQLFGILETAVADQKTFGNLDLDSQLALVAKLADDEIDLRAWCSWRKARRSACENGLADLISKIEHGAVQHDQIVKAFKVNYARSWAMQATDRSPAIRGFIALNHENKIRTFRELDDLHRKLTAEIVKLRIQRKIPDLHSGSRTSEQGILRREIEKKTRHKPIRRLLSEIPTLAAAIAPCFMMSPLSIAQYFSPESRKFDLVIFDEASQIPVWDAVGAIARGTQVIMVGDQKQLPPTSFFDRAESDDEIDEDLVDLQSILDECVASSLPTRKLLWHYRSRHESLITFSNRKYYDGGLITFPSPSTRDAAVSTKFVGGTYLRGSGAENRKNPSEARAVVDEVIAQLKSFPDESVGVVTFNMSQKNEIDNLLDAARRDDPSLEPHFSTDRIEPVMVKNLESVQGDERDVMFFSTTFGRDTAGKILMNFGPLSRIGGERRLNVAITRARKRLRVITSLRPEDIDLSRTRAQGVADLKVFLDYATRGVAALDAEIDERGGESDSPFEDAVANALRARGWKIRQQIGVSGLKIDLAVVDPDADGAYLAGIECDGATYHSSATARDRDQVRESVLRGLGWEILRVWSTDWFYNENAVVERLHSKLTQLAEDSSAKRLLEENAVETEACQSPQTMPTELIEENTTVPIATQSTHVELSSRLIAGSRNTKKSGSIPAEANMSSSSRHDTFVFADSNKIEGQISPEKFYESSYTATIRDMADYIVEVEGPIREQDLVGRIRSWHGWGRAGNRIRQRILESVSEGIQTTVEDDGSVFFWPTAKHPSQSLAFRRPDDSGDRRSVFEISMPELRGLASEFADSKADNETIIRSMQDAVGMLRLGETARERLQSALDQERRRESRT